jgi:hypothetical protein
MGCSKFWSKKLEKVHVFFLLTEYDFWKINFIILLLGSDLHAFARGEVKHQISDDLLRAQAPTTACHEPH